MSLQLRYAILFIGIASFSHVLFSMETQAGHKRNHEDSSESSDYLSLLIPEHLSPLCIDGSLSLNPTILNLNLNALEPLSRASYAELLSNETGALLAVITYFDKKKLVYRVYDGVSLASYLHQREFADDGDVYDPTSKQRILKILYYLLPTAQPKPKFFIGTREELVEGEFLPEIIEGVRGNSQSLCHLAKMFAGGDEVEQNIELAQIYSRLAIKKGSIEAMVTLAKLYADEDPKKAFKWYKKAADKECGQAQYYLAVCYEKGRGVESDMTIAHEFYEKAAMNGFAPAMYHLATLYTHGRGCAVNFDKARYWFKQAMEYGDCEIHGIAQKELLNLRRKESNAL